MEFLQHAQVRLSQTMSHLNGRGSAEQTLHPGGTLSYIIPFSFSASAMILAVSVLPRGVKWPMEPSGRWM